MIGARRSFDWRRPLVYTHRWLGIAGCGLFLTWFASGIVMMYARMPSLAPEERLARTATLDLSRLAVAPSVAAERLGTQPDSLRIGMLGDRPVYHFTTHGQRRTVFADDGQPLDGLTEDKALELARRFSAERSATLRHAATLTDVDQWTIGARRLLPLHRIALNDPEDTQLYISERTGEAVTWTTRGSRFWGFAGAVLHWIYFTPLRRHPAVWNQAILWLSLAGCVLSLSGLAWGVVRFAIHPRYRFPAGSARTPYAGSMRWHHYAGLVFGAVTFTWIFSGLLSMNPWDWSPDTEPTESQREGAAGGPFHAEDLTAEALQLTVGRIRDPATLKELEVLRFRGATYLRVVRAAGATEALIVPAQGGAALRTFDAAQLAAAARDAMPGTTVEDATWLEAYDHYYYDREARAPLPVLRVRFADQPRTWLYLDAASGSIVRKEERLSRVNRWLYHGLHSLDFPFLYDRRPLWDLVVILLSLGGMVLTVASLAPAVRRLRRAALRLTRR